MSEKDPFKIRKMYNWVMSWSEHPHGVKALGFISAIEAIFFPLPVDPLLVAMGVGKPKKAIWYAGVAIFWSVLGGVIGYGIGYYLWAEWQGVFYEYVFSPAKMDMVLQKFNENAFVAVFLASFTPIPFKVFTIASGVAKLSWLPFLSGAILGRGLRFLIIGAIIYKFGDDARRIIDTHFQKLTIIGGLVVVAVFIVYKLI